MSLFSEKDEQERIKTQQQQQRGNDDENDDTGSGNTLSVVQQHYDRQEEYIAAQRAASEAIHVGRETLETAERQGEQLQNAETMADETEYKLDRANRILRGMTWTGWLQNKFARDVEPPQYKDCNNGNIQEEEEDGPPKVYDDIPVVCNAAAQAIQNYHANLQVLNECETYEQKETCKLICDNMYQHARSEVQCLCRSPAATATGPTATLSTGSLSPSCRKFTSRLETDLTTLRQRQLSLQQQPTKSRPASFAEVHASMEPSSSNNNNNNETTSKDMLFESGNSSKAKASPQKNAVDVVSQRQEEHLDSMARHLHELGSLANNINVSLEQQTDTLDTLDEKNDSMIFKSKMVTRRADHLIQKKAWIKDKPEFVQYASIQHVPSGKYLSVAPNNDTTLILTGNTKLTDRCIFGMWKKGGAVKNSKRSQQIFGLQNQYNKRWAGQTLLGNLACSASTFSHREEWDIDEREDAWKTTGTTLLVASAGWGVGGYLLLSGDGDAANSNNLPTIGGGGLQDKKNAPKWIIKSFEKKR